MVTLLIFKRLHTPLILCSIAVTMNKLINIIFLPTCVILATDTVVHILISLLPPASSAPMKTYHFLLYAWEETMTPSVRVIVVSSHDGDMKISL